jgi:hypothetical protein
MRYLYTLLKYLHFCSEIFNEKLRGKKDPDPHPRHKIYRYQQIQSYHLITSYRNLSKKGIDLALLDPDLECGSENGSNSKEIDKN